MKIIHKALSTIFISLIISSTSLAGILFFRNCSDKIAYITVFKLKDIKQQFPSQQLLIHPGERRKITCRDSLFKTDTDGCRVSIQYDDGLPNIHYDHLPDGDYVMNYRTTPKHDYTIHHRKTICNLRR